MLALVQNKAICFVSNLKRKDGVTCEKERLGLVATGDWGLHTIIIDCHCTTYRYTNAIKKVKHSF